MLGMLLDVVIWSKNRCARGKEISVPLLDFQLTQQGGIFVVTSEDMSGSESGATLMHRQIWSDYGFAKGEEEKKELSCTFCGNFFPPIFLKINNVNLK